MRYCADIGMFAIDRPESSCVHATAFCQAHCYNRKLYAMYDAMRACDRRLAAEWETLDPAEVRAELDRKHSRQTKRVRMMTRGECFASPYDVEKMEAIANDSPDTDFWIPTRAWRNRSMRERVERLSRRCPNLKIIASTDPSTTRREQAMLDRRGWSTMFFGDDTDQAAFTLTGQRRTRCAKTWQHLKGHCARCKVGCFRVEAIRPGAELIHVWLSQH